MLVIREDQLEALGAAIEARQKRRILKHLQEEFADPLYPVDIFDYLYRRAVELGYEEEVHIHRFCRLAPFLGEAPREHPLVRWISTQAANEQMTPAARLRFLENEVMPRLLADRWRRSGRY